MGQHCGVHLAQRNKAMQTFGCMYQKPTLGKYVANFGQSGQHSRVFWGQQGAGCPHCSGPQICHLPPLLCLRDCCDPSSQSPGFSAVHRDVLQKGQPRCTNFDTCASSSVPSQPWETSDKYEPYLHHPWGPTPVSVPRVQRGFWYTPWTGHGNLCTAAVWREWTGLQTGHSTLCSWARPQMLVPVSGPPRTRTHQHEPAINNASVGCDSWTLAEMYSCLR